MVRNREQGEEKRRTDRMSYQDANRIVRDFSTDREYMVDLIRKYGLPSFFDTGRGYSEIRAEAEKLRGVAEKMLRTRPETRRDLERRAILYNVGNLDKYLEQARKYAVDLEEGLRDQDYELEQELMLEIDALDERIAIQLEGCDFSEEDAVLLGKNYAILREKVDRVMKRAA